MANKLEYHPTPGYKRLGSSSINGIVQRWGTSMGLWGAGAGVAVLYLLSVTPIVKNGFLVKIPLLGSYYEDKIPASDKPF